MRINGLDATVPVKVEGKENLMISVSGAGDVEEKSYSVICEDRGSVEPLSGPNEVNDNNATAYRFVFDDDWELGTVNLIADQNIIIDGIAITAEAEIYKLHLCYSLQAETTTAIGIDFESLSWVEPEPQVSVSGEYDVVTIIATETYKRVGAPVIPKKAVTVLVPYGMKVLNVQVDAVGVKNLEGAYSLAPAQEAHLMNSKITPEPTPPNPKIYSMTTEWPGKYHEVVSTQSKRGYEQLILNLLPVQNLPAVSGTRVGLDQICYLKSRPPTR